MTLDLTALTNGVMRLLRRSGHAYPADPSIWPEAITVGANTLTAGTTASTVLLVAGLPPDVVPGWLEAVTAIPEVTATSMHIAPVGAERAATSLRTKRTRLEASRRYAFGRGHLSDPEVEAAADDASDLANRLAAGETRLFTLAVYILVQTRTSAETTEAVAAVRAHAAAAGLTVRPASFRQLQGLTSILPIARDQIATTRTVDTDTIAAAYPFTTYNPPVNTGILLGSNTATGGPVFFDRFTQPNHNQVVVARSGAGKSFLTKTEIARWAIRGVGVTVIDPDGEYTALAEHLDGTVIHVGGDQMRINPLDIPASTDKDAFARRVMFCHTIAATCLTRDLSGDEAAALDTALLAAYAEKGIGFAPDTWTRPAPTMRDVHTQLTRGDEQGRALAARLTPYVTGAFNSLFDGPTTDTPTGHLVVFNLAGLPDELTAIATVLMLDAAWRRATSPGRHLVFVDEAWRLLSTTTGAAFLSRLAKSARKHSAGLSVITQDAEDMLASELGRTVIANSATALLMSQAPAALRLVADAFALTGAEQTVLASARPGDALLLSGTTHVSFSSTPADLSVDLLTTGEGASR